MRKVSVTITSVIPLEVYHALCEMADEEGVSRSMVVRRLLSAGLELAAEKKEAEKDDKHDKRRR